MSKPSIFITGASGLVGPDPANADKAIADFLEEDSCGNRADTA